MSFNVPPFLMCTCACVPMSIFHTVCDMLAPIFMVLYFRPYSSLFYLLTAAPYVENPAHLRVILGFGGFKFQSWAWPQNKVFDSCNTNLAYFSQMSKNTSQKINADKWDWGIFWVIFRYKISSRTPWTPKVFDLWNLKNFWMTWIPSSTLTWYPSTSLM